MKKMLSVLVMALIPSSIFALAGFGVQLGSDLSKLGSYSFSEGSGLTEVTINTYEMESNPGSFGGYAFVDLFGFALEAEAEGALGQYEFDFTNAFLPEMEEKIPFVWGRGSYSFTLKKNIMDISIPFLAKAAINAGGGFGKHAATKRVNVEMVRSILGEEDLANVELGQNEIESLLEDFLTNKDNWEEASGLHLQAGLRFKVLVLDTHINARYNLAKDIYTDKAGWLQLMFKMGFAI
tara:strand:+ start:317 stop:1027 length:711 start_codon:yes stop_codon:yes gene_type:complete